MMLVDVHAHMDIDGFIGKKLDIDQAITKCIKSDVVAIVSQGVNIESNRDVLKLAQKHKIIKPALGIYPVHCFEMISQGKEKEFNLEIEFIDQQLKNKKIVAIGEVGLDYKEIEPTDENKKILKDCLKKFLDLAKKYDVPIILHSRGAELDLIEFLEQEGMKNRRVIMHCFSGRKHLVQRIIDNGWFLTVPAIVARLEHFQYIARDAPLNQLLTETDSPMLSPDSNTLNDPSNVIFAIKKIAEIKKMDENEVANIIYNNYQRLFQQ
ncbi:TPA: TatD family hydrolase [Candidatus Woesearchaeota archaeon]|nr:TatD family hydrolase [Candidatus Woesearchaeota archaeon]HIH31124.1 TatD family hydrolase [Candidatus Woesearchaeota archaeon]HIH54605.1 TatD family hydrolase [Candidatus Woesearchaeota archaeon]HIJ02341.1 TatD family hydrolase [Candidatus Woesearchaeota archaeon]HIJ14181.1 TatD family hydrolase [Candidatus Woesearchaeota archaeon]